MSRINRAFIAFPVTGEQAEQFVQLAEHLEELGLPYNWIPPMRYHITIAFLGSVTTQEVEKAAAMLEEEQENYKPPMVEPAGLTGFPSETKAKVLAVKIGGKNSTRLQRQTSKIRRKLQEENVWFDPKPFVPHISLGRSRKRVRLGEYDHLLEGSQPIELPEPRLYVSALNGEGDGYRPV